VKGLRATHTAPDDLTRPASEADVQRAYLDATSMGYALAGVGAVTALIGATLALSESEEGLHAVGLALGLLAAGLITDRLDRSIGTARVHVGALVLLALAVLALAWSPALGVTVFGAAGVGLGFGIMFAHVNQTLAAGGGSSARVRLARVTLIAQVSSLTVPLVIWIVGKAGLGWSFVALPVVVMVGLSLVFTRGRQYRPIPMGTDAGTLPRAYWTAWLFVVMVNAFEWTIIFWASTLVEQQTSVSLGDATLVISMFFGGMVMARSALSLRAVGRREPVRLIRAGLVVLVVGSIVVWASPSYAISMVGFLAMGVGSGVQFPLGIALTLDTAPLQPQLASSRLVLASGLGILITPLLLGIVADASSVSVGWLVVPFMCLIGLALTVPVVRNRRIAVATVPAG
jgi:MFS family permease